MRTANRRLYCQALRAFLRFLATVSSSRQVWAIAGMKHPIEISSKAVEDGCPHVMGGAAQCLPIYHKGRLTNTDSDHYRNGGLDKLKVVGKQRIAKGHTLC